MCGAPYASKYAKKEKNMTILEIYNGVLLATMDNYLWNNILL